MASIIKRGDSYQVKIRIKGHPAESTSFSRKTDATNYAKQRETEIRQGKHLKEAVSKRYTFAQMIDRYLKVGFTDKPKSFNKQRNQLERWKAELGQYSLFDVTATRITEVKERLLNEPLKNGKKRAPATVVRYMAALSPVYRMAVNEWEWLEKSPLDKVKRPKESNGVVRFLSTDERHRLLDKAKSHPHPNMYVLIVLAISTGMRQGEILGLKREDLFLSDGYALLHETKNNESRRVPITGFALDVLKNFCKVVRMDTPYIFADKTTSKPVFNYRAWEDVLKLAEVENFRFHDLRHTCASYLAMNGASLAEIAEVLGHKTLNMVKRYAHLSDSHTSSVVASMNDKIFAGN
ncbi:tyrosine-type recombinase/integrase [Marinicella litoralis]|uniref:Site-specific recombinase XerD n=1 Tax=Marinicella litoralis TaxID=644220 RepID=A0A4R6Y2E5_9GAMM|nr:site-specific integrase [Marinicella litoralis]TDR23148.1 site-specific recombinase XerD [Marinicella litoralis]